MATDLWKSFFDTSRGRTIALIRRSGSATVEEIASGLELTPNAVRLQLATLERDGLVRRRGQRASPTRPAQLYEVTPELEQLLSRAYIPLTAQLVDLLGARLDGHGLADLMRETGRRLAAAVPPRAVPDGPLEERLRAVSRLLNQELGAVTDLEPAGNGRFILRGRGCPLAALTGAHKAVCLVVEALVAEAAGADARQCCETESERPRCCFEVRERAP